MTAPINPAFYADPRGLAELRNDARANDPAALREAAKQFESLFTKILLKSMREANESFGDSMFSSEQTEFYQGMFDDQIAVQLSQGKGLGLAEMLVQQLTRAGLAKADEIVGGAAPSPTLPRIAGEGGKSGIVSGSSRQGDGSAKVIAEGLLPRSPGEGRVGASASPITSSKEDFIKTFLPHAEKAARQLGVDPHALLAQAALETGWGKSVPCTPSGACSFNLFGIKAGSQWSGATVSVPTLEFEEGIPVRKVERFRAYESAAESFADYAKLLGNSSRYAGVRGAGSDIASFAAALQQGGYATDPEYARKIVSVANELRSVTSRADLKIDAARSLHSRGV